MSRPRALAAASEEHVGQAAMAVLPRGNAVDAVVAGVFAAAGAARGVLFGPVQLVVGGAGAGLRAVDGRTLQPGKGSKRPRGWLPGEPIPPAARVAVPLLPAALAVALASFGSTPLSRALGPAIELARIKSTARAEILERLARRGPRLARSAVAEELLEAAGRPRGGLVGPEDLEALRPAITACATVDLNGRGTGTVPWGAETVRRGGSGPASSAVHVVAAMDGRGLAAIACYEEAIEGLPIEGLDLIAPYCAEPVMRGEPRVRPGTPRSAAAPIALSEARGRIELAVGIAGAPDGERELHDWLLAREGALPGAGRLVRVGSTAARVG